MITTKTDFQLLYRLACDMYCHLNNIKDLQGYEQANKDYNDLLDFMKRYAMDLPIAKVDESML